MTRISRSFLAFLAFTCLVGGPGLAAQETARHDAPALFVAISRTGWGIPIGPTQGLIPPADVLEAIQTSAKAFDLDLAITIYPDRADCILSLELNEVHAGAPRSWALIDAASGTILERGARGSLRIAAHEAVKAVGRHASGGNRCRGDR